MELIRCIFLTGKTWNIPGDAVKPSRALRPGAKPIRLIDVLKRERESKLSGGIYHKIQIYRGLKEWNMNAPLKMVHRSGK